jgi:hypothetical protein
MRKSENKAAWNYLQQTVSSGPPTCLSLIHYDKKFSFLRVEVPFLSLFK